ncbi:thiamine pyrophosphate-binding protein [Cryobacterium sp. TMS1-20-1]|uniref:thiamine pyrophosphate-binding protein n=1 Tax=Cryobacterium sp. TMS1-20-1 TaxID=1259223 RepID=UPI00106DBB8A|nr:thiamine pyrophosphate-binding protein [Cryobacterium sp. TMS1-20-1]TFC74889.1 thiamine pyrophosphate-binding protein [Cryobacterium sp. TMS1-20-1]
MSPASGTLKLHQALARYLVESGTDVMFGLIGDGNLFMVDSYTREFGGTYLSVAHEANSVLAAIGYARVSGRVGVATVTHGPAFTNTMTALVEGVRSRTPIVLIAGDTAREDRRNLQNIEQREVARSTGAGFVELRSERTWLEDVRAAFRQATIERRPVVLNVPIDFIWRDVAWGGPYPSAVVETEAVPSASALNEAVGALASARRPIVLAGRGASSAAARRQLVRLAERIGAPLATTIGGKDLFAGEPFDLGVFGTLSTDATVSAIIASDCIIAFGASLNHFTTAEESYLVGKTVIVCDRDPGRTQSSSPNLVVVTGDAALTAEAIVEWLDEGEIEPTGFRDRMQLSSAAATVASSRAAPSAPADIALPIRRVYDMLDERLPDDCVIVTDGGRFMPLAWQGLHVKHPRHLVTTVSFGAIGNGMGHALGAAMAEPDLPVVLVTGDGGFMLGGLTEFNSAVRHGLNLTVVILNDGGYGAEYVQFEARNMDPDLSLLGWADFAPVGIALGGSGRTVATLDELGAVLDGLSLSGLPTIVDIKLDPRSIPNAMH